MKNSKYKIAAIQFLLLNQFFLSSLYLPRPILSKENINQPTSEYLTDIPDTQYYILGPGDLLKITVSDTSKDLNKTFNINGEGIANLKRLKRIYASGLTISELTKLLNKEYSAYVKEPDVELEVIEYRPVQVYLDGEVEEPGLHILPGGFSRSNIVDRYRSNDNKYDNDKIRTLGTLPSSQTELTNQNILFPTVMDAIRLSGGITQNANLTDIKITRTNSISNGSGKIKTSINLLEALMLKDTSNNIRVKDGDTIYISRSDSPIQSQISKAIKSNLNPRYINVFVGGRVEIQGTISIRKNAVLTEAIAFSGGTKAIKGDVKFMRYNSDGSIDKRTFSLDTSAKKGSAGNPYLKDGDVIFVQKSPINVAGEVIRDINMPITGLFSTWALYKAVFN